MILGPDGEPVDVEPIPLALKEDPYERTALWLVMGHAAGVFRHDDDEEEYNAA
jgi:hypothetical protein